MYNFAKSFHICPVLQNLFGFVQFCKIFFRFVQFCKIFYLSSFAKSFSDLSSFAKSFQSNFEKSFQICPVLQIHLRFVPFREIAANLFGFEKSFSNLYPVWNIVLKFVRTTAASPGPGPLFSVWSWWRFFGIRDCGDVFLRTRQCQLCKIKNLPNLVDWSSETSEYVNVPAKFFLNRIVSWRKELQIIKVFSLITMEWKFLKVKQTYVATHEKIDSFGGNRAIWAIPAETVILEKFWRNYGRKLVIFWGKLKKVLGRF